MTNKKDYIFVKHIKVSDRIISKIYIKDILFVESDRDYSKVFTSKNMYYVHLALKEMALALPCDIFFRCSRSYVVNIDRIDKILENSIHIENSVIKISKNKRGEFLKKINILGTKV